MSQPPGWLTPEMGHIPGDAGRYGSVLLEDVIRAHEQPAVGADPYAETRLWPVYFRGPQKLGDASYLRVERVRYERGRWRVSLYAVAESPRQAEKMRRERLAEPDPEGEWPYGPSGAIRWQARGPGAA